MTLYKLQQVMLRGLTDFFPVVEGKKNALPRYCYGVLQPRVVSYSCW